MARTGERKDPYGNYHFLIELDGITRAGFRECSGLDSTTSPTEYREGTDPLTSRKLPGQVSYSDISLRWGLADDTQLWEWRKQVVDGKVERKNGSIVLLDDSGDEKARWNFVAAWPTKWTGPELNATGSDVAIESIDIAHEGLTRA